MQHSGTKLVIALTSLALVLGATSWWYRYEAAHRATQFWGAVSARLIAESENLEALTFDPATADVVAALRPRPMGKSIDLSHARGQAHLRHALMSDRNYIWGELRDTAEIEWRWCLRFHESELQAYVVLSDDLTVIGKYEPSTDTRTAHTLTALSCQPMTSSLAEYFRALGLLARPSE